MPKWLVRVGLILMAVELAMVAYAVVIWTILFIYGGD